MQGHTPVQLVCFDVEKPDLIGMVDPEELTSEDIYAPQPVIDISKCRYCGVCSGYCPEKAIQFNRFIPSVTLIVSRCFACGNCIKSCERNGIRMQEKLAGKILKGRIGQHSFVAGKLEEKSDFKMPLLKAVLDALDPEAATICDFEPGAGTPVSFCLAKMDIACVVVQPENDWERNLNSMFKLIKEAKIPAGVILNKIKSESAFVAEVKAYCTNHSIPLLGIIPFDKSIGNTKDSNNTDYPEETEQAFTQIRENLLAQFPSLFLTQKTTL